MRGGSARRHAAVALVATPMALASLFARKARAADVDPAQPLTLVVGPAPGFAPMARLDDRRRGQSATPLPIHPHTLWRRTVRGGLDATPLAVDARGAVIAASFHAAEIVQFSADGLEMWRRPTGLAPSIAGVVLLNDDTRAIVTSAGEAVGYSPTGAIRFRVVVDLLERTSRIGLLPLEGGGLALAAGADVIELDGDGRVNARARLPERIQGPLVLTRAGILATTPSGAVYAIRPGFAARLGTLGGDPGEVGASTPDGSRLFAVVDGQRIAVLDLATGTLETRWSIADRSLLGPVVFGRERSLVAATALGALVTSAENGASPQRLALEPRPLLPSPDPTRVDVSAMDEVPPPLPDALGRIAFARAGGRLGIAAPDGAIRLVDEPVCASPVALVPAGPRRVAVACRTGSIVMMGDEPAP